MTVPGTFPSIPAALVFDCDGTLVDTESHWQAARMRSFSEFGLKAPPGFAERAAGVHYTECGSLMAEETGTPELADALTQALLSHFTELADTAPTTMPGAEDLVRLVSGRLPLAVASNCPAAVVEASLGRAGLLDHFDHLVVPDEELRPKPEPDLYSRAADLCGTPPGDTLAFEDSLTGIEAARRAGLRVVGVGRQPGWQEHPANWWVDTLDALELVSWMRGTLPDATD
ncbi:HAD family hydrolase [Streptomyces sp. NPDC127068]|uniref:HAD family hydrolase n=1 Tax=Streptomyces sp. NPDC127068 TaxID=3347127 RepID=UPI00364BCBF4